MVEVAEQQQEELTAVQSIYEDCFEIVSTELGKAEAMFRTKLKFSDSDPLRVATGCNCGDRFSQQVALLRSLPPVTLRVQLPANYPNDAAPKFSLSCMWLSRDSIRKLRLRFDELWTEAANSGVLFAVISFLQTEMLDYLEISTNKVFELQREFRHTNGSRAGYGKQDSVDALASGANDTTLRLEQSTSATDPNTSLPSSSVCDSSEHAASVSDTKSASQTSKAQCGALHALLRTLTEHDAAVREAELANERVECQICFEVFFGRESLRVDRCGHIFCTECLGQYVQTRVEQNDVMALQCAAHECDTLLPHALIRRAVSSSAYERFEELQIQATLASMTDIVYCPRPTCRQPVLGEQSSNMAICSVCSLVFCSYCFYTYHGVAPCSLKVDKLLQLRNLYLQSDEAARKQLEVRHGKHLIKQAVEEAASIEWLRDNAKPCPTCGTGVQKLDGCNKMTCTKCGCYFCWLCGDRLDKSDPYGHYRDGKPCGGQLFLGMASDNEDDDEWVDEDDEEDDDGMFRLLR